MGAARTPKAPKEKKSKGDKEKKKEKKGDKESSSKDGKKEKKKKETSSKDSSKDGKKEKKKKKETSEKPSKKKLKWKDEVEGKGPWYQFGRVYYFDFMPTGFFSRIMSRLFSHEEFSIKAYWRRGIYLTTVNINLFKKSF